MDGYAVFPALALPNVDDHAFAVDVLDPQNSSSLRHLPVE
jgi:hypothetical protein